MATLRKRGKSYTILVTKTIGYRSKKSNIQKVIASFKLGKISKETAIRHKLEVNLVEPLILNGELNADNWKNHFSFLNDECKHGIIEYMTLGAAIDMFLDYKKDAVRESSYNRIRISMDRFLEVIPSNTVLTKIKLTHIDSYKKYFNKKLELAGVRRLEFFKYCDEHPDDPYCAEWKSNLKS